MATSDATKPCLIGDIIEGKESGQEIVLKLDGESTKCYQTLAKQDNAKGVAALVVHDIFGYQLPNTRRIVDYLAANGIHALLVDFWHGDVWTPEMDWKDFPVWRAAKQNVDQIRKLGDITKHLKTLPSVKSLAVVGFCWGGGAVHSWLEGEKVKLGAIQAPYLGIFGAEDTMIPAEKVNGLKAALDEDAPDIPHKVVLVAGQGHGFAHRKRAASKGDADDKAQTQVLADMIQWIDKYACELEKQAQDSK